LNAAGFEVRFHVRTDEQDTDVLVTMTRGAARGLEVGSKVWLVPSKGALTVPLMTPRGDETFSSDEAVAV